MSFRNSSDGYGAVARFLHWATAFIVIFLLGLGLYMTGLDLSPAKLSLYGLHKSFGTLVLGLAVVRILWRAGNAPPPHLHTHRRHEIVLARFIHFCLYLALLGMPLSGWLMTSANDYPHTFFNLFSMPDIYPGKNETVYELMGLAHELCAYALIGAVLLHFAGAIKHHVIDRDATLRRMLGARPARMMAGVAVLFAALAAVYFGAASLKAAPVTAPVAAQADAPDATRMADAPAAPGWTIDAAQSFAEFTVTVQGGPFSGKFAGMAGTVHFDPDNLPGSRADVTVSIPAVATGAADRDSAIVSPAWMDAAAFPESRFVAREIVAAGENRYEVRGTLTLRGVALPVTVPFTLEISTDSEGNKVAKMDGAFTLQRLDFGVGQGEWAGTDMVANPVNVRVSVTARREIP